MLHSLSSLDFLLLRRVLAGGVVPIRPWVGGGPILPCGPVSGGYPSPCPDGPGCKCCSDDDVTIRRVLGRAPVGEAGVAGVAGMAGGLSLSVAMPIIIHLPPTLTMMGGLPRRGW